MRRKKMIFGERRLYERKPCRIRVDIDDYRRSYDCSLRDLSLGGALLDAPRYFKPALGQEVLLNIAYRNKPGAVVVKGLVVRFDSEELAVVFAKNMVSTLSQAV